MNTTTRTPHPGTGRGPLVGAGFVLGLLLNACEDLRPPTSVEPSASLAAADVAPAAAAAVADGQYRIQVAHSGKCLSLADTARGARVEQQTCADVIAQRFAVEKVGTAGGTAYYRLKPRGGSRCAVIENASRDNGAAVIQWDCPTDLVTKPNRLFSLRQSGPEGFSLVAKHSGKCVDVVDALTANGTRLHQWECLDVPQQRFRLLGPGTGPSSAPPATIADYIRPGAPVVRRVAYDGDIAVYFGDGMDPGVTWMNDYIRQAWRYMKRTYGSFGPDSRIYVVAHTNRAFDYATVNTRFDDGFGYRNVIDLGGVWDWQRPQQLNYEVITHELAHIVEGGGKDTKESPSFEVWTDGPWPEIFIYDVYKALGRDDWARDWYNRMLTNTNGSYSPDLPGRYYTFRDWFYPIYSRHGGAAVFNRYFTLLSQCFPKKDITVDWGQTAKEYARRANVGEFVHFWSGAAGVNLKAQFTKAYAWNSKFEGEFRQAQRTFACANNYPK